MRHGWCSGKEKTRPFISPIPCVRITRITLVFIKVCVKTILPAERGTSKEGEKGLTSCRERARRNKIIKKAKGDCNRSSWAAQCIPSVQIMPVTQFCSKLAARKKKAPVSRDVSLRRVVNFINKIELSNLMHLTFYQWSKQGWSLVDHWSINSPIHSHSSW